MNFYKLKVFCLVVETGSITEAAKKLLISVPAVSMHLRDVEKHFKTTLTFRHGRNIKITETGLSLYKFAEQVLKMEEDIRTTLQTKVQRLKIGVSLFVVGLLRELLTNQNFSTINLIIKPELSFNIYQQVLDGNLDLGLVMNRGTPKMQHKLTQENIMQIPLVVICPPSHPLNNKVVKKEEIEYEPFIITAHQRRNPYGVVGHTGLQIKNQILEINDMETLKLAVMHGKGLSVASIPDVEKDIHEGKIGLIQISNFTFDTRFSLIYLPHTSNSLKSFKQDFLKILPLKYRCLIS